MSEHIVFLYDEDIKKIVAKYYNAKAENCIFMPIKDNSGNICPKYKIVFDKEE